MSQIVVDTDVVSYLFNWHSLAQRYANVLRGSELRMGAISAGWGAAGAFSSNDSCKVSNWFTRTTTYVRFGRGFVLMREPQAGH